MLIVITHKTMHKILITIFISSLLFSSSSWSNEKTAPIAKVSVLSSGKVLLNGSTINTETLRSEFKKLKINKGEVWYYRENARNEPPPIANTVIKLIIDNELPVTLSTKPDFSNYVDENGNIHKRKNGL